jgi:hypothetical protein
MGIAGERIVAFFRPVTIQVAELREVITIEAASLTSLA